MRSEPVLNTGLVVALIVAALQLLRSFGYSVTTEQEKALIDFVTVVLQIATIIGGAVFARSFVTPVKD
jgi:uncharacterized membrane protein